MTKLIVGRFDNIDGAKAVLGELRMAGFRPREFGLFYVAPPGQHDLYPIGGDAHSDEGARESGGGAATGAAVGGATGLAAGAVLAATIPVAGLAALLAATGIGAYIGSLHGALAKTQRAEEGDATPEHPVEQPGGPRVAVAVERPGTEEQAIGLLQRHGAEDIGRAEGEWHRGIWTDFDPRVPPEPVADPHHQ